MFFQIDRSLDINTSVSLEVFFLFGLFRNSKTNLAKKYQSVTMHLKGFSGEGYDWTIN